MGDFDEPHIVLAERRGRGRASAAATRWPARARTALRGVRRARLGRRPERIAARPGALDPGRPVTSRGAASRSCRPSAGAAACCACTRRACCSAERGCRAPGRPRRRRSGAATPAEDLDHRRGGRDRARRAASPRRRGAPARVGQRAHDDVGRARWRARAAGSARRRRRRRRGPGPSGSRRSRRRPSGSKPAAWQERTTWRAHGLAADVCTHASLAQVLETQARLVGERVVGAAAPRASGPSSSSMAREAGAELDRRRRGTRTAARGRTRRRAGAARSPPARPRPASARPRVRRRGSRAIASGISVAPAVGNEAMRSRPRAHAEDRRPAPPRRPRGGRGSPSACATSAAPAAVGRTPRRSRSSSVAPVSASSVAIACETADCV